ncbi:M43 family zinc metalloprotease [Flavobacteriaceae bacterium S0825]|uniref:M43 family zinc metalloprotease n=1 Tax=Gaetbulibacter sp. S0825 TaxID=2720084 RepID=UPI00143097D8|nr:M43 family zinc metalloprotease [Gaetbulibacter sp. S0825]MCK0107752.1 M43 family zinc metalloprotease [Flavobacteriaceae bacterium S0825]NIX63388.1 T9SS type A sorting domain-containing protein [Gaetbulibacter sp. S0825]
MDFKNTTLNILFLSVLLSCMATFAQQIEPERCATDEYNKLLLKDNPNMMGSQAFEKKLSKQIQLNKLKRSSINGAVNRRVVYTIPVVVHVIHNGEAIGVGTNISDAQVLSQIQVLNEDFRKLSGTRGFNTHPDGADVEVEFCLAQQTPDGCVTNGINRINMSATSTSWSGPGGNTDIVLKPATIWDPSKYMNIWTVKFSNSGNLGYAQFPDTMESLNNGAANTDGVVIGYQYFGTEDDPNVTLPLLPGFEVFNLGRTATHEVGHYLGLWHTFKDGCTGNGDYCDDTPAVASSTSNSNICNTGNDSCPTPPGFPDMVENYMDYSQDSCMNVFTNDQKARMVAAITIASRRPTTLSSNVCTPLASVNDDSSVQIEGIAIENCGFNVTPSVRITNWGTNTLTSAVITYDEDGGISSNYNWSGSLNYGEFEVFNLPTIVSTPGNHSFNASVSSPNGNSDSRSCNDDTNASFNLNPSYASTAQVHLTLTPDSFGSEITWEFRDSGNNLLNNGGPYTDGNTDVINETFNVVANECYTFTIFDVPGDGICCDFGIGSYELKTDDNTIITSGGNYGVSETTKVSTMVTLRGNEYFVDNRISIYPNPTNRILNIKLANRNDLPDGYKIYNMLGQLVKEKQINNSSQLKVDASSLSNGMYFIKVIKEKASLSLPFIKK